MARARLALWNDKRSDAPDAPVYVVIQHERKRATLATGVRVAPGDWNEQKQEVRRSRKKASKLNKRLREVEAEAAAVLDDLVASGRPFAAAEARDELAARLDPEPEAEEATVDFFVFMRDWVEGFSERGQPSTYKAYRTAYRKLSGYVGGPLPYENLTTALVQSWGRTLAAPPPHGPGHKQNYVRKLLTSTRTAVREAIRVGHAPQDFRDPFERLDGDPLLRTERVTKRRLTAEEVVAIAEADCQPGTLVEAVRDAFALAFFAGGMRFGDVALLRWADVERDGDGAPVRLVYEAEKTGKPTPVPIIPEAGAILKKYPPRAGSPFVLPLLDGRDVSTPAKRRSAISARNAYANKVLKKLAKRAGVNNPQSVTFHVARHSLAAYLLDSGLSAHSIKEVLQHSSVQVTERYLSGFDRGLLDAAYRSAFEKGE